MIPLPGYSETEGTADCYGSIEGASVPDDPAGDRADFVPDDVHGPL